MMALKSLGKLVGNLKGKVTLADFVIFSVLGSINDKELKKTVKGQKTLKARWTEVSKDAKVKSLLQACVNRCYN